MPKRVTKYDFINNAKTKHGDNYEYSLVDYVNSATKIIIGCKQHGNFEQTPNSHLKGQGCPKCGFELVHKSNTLTNDSFILEAVKIHRDKYDYSLVEYMNAKDCVTIICSLHGEFDQKPTHHLQGSGCPMCRESKGELAVSIWLKDNSINYIRNHRFNDCRDKQPLPFDFYIPTYNICIEFDGRHHFEPITEWGGLDYLYDIQRKDNIKTNYCIINNIKLIRIDFKSIDYIDNIMHNQLKDCEEFKNKVEIK